MSGTTTSSDAAEAVAGAGAGAFAAGGGAAAGLGGAAFEGAGAGAGAAALASPDSTTTSEEPCETLSPSLTSNCLMTPAADDGISIDALSLSTVTSDCSLEIESPGFTRS